MPEVLVLKEELKGLRASAEVPLNSPGLADCRAWRPGEKRLSTHRQITDLISDAELTAEGITISHPFPQVFISAGYAVLCTETKVYAIDLTDRTLTEYAYYDVDSLEATTVQAGGVWHFADYGEGFFLFNGVSTLFLRNGLLFVESSLTIQTGCYFRGRMVFAGFDPANSWKRGWHTLVNELLASDLAAYSALAGLSLEGFRSNLVWWSTIGGGDIFSLFYPEYAASGYMIGQEHLTNGSFTGSAASWSLTNVSYSSNSLVKIAGSAGSAVQLNASLALPITTGQRYLIKFKVSNRTAGTIHFKMGANVTATTSSNGVHIAYLTAVAGTNNFEIIFSASAAMTLEWVTLRSVLSDNTDPLFQEKQRLNQQGFWRVDYEGTVLCTKPLGNSVICYGTNGVSALLHYAAPVPTFGEKVLLRVGVADRGAIGGGEYEHIFLDTSGQAWLLDIELKLTPLLYDEYLAALVGEPITISHNSQENEYRITGRDSASVDSPKTPLPFLLVDRQLARSPEVVTSALFLDGEFLGCREASLVEDDAYLKTNLYDLDTRSLKYIVGLEFAFRGSGLLEAALEYRVGAADDLIQTEWIEVDGNGYCRVSATVAEFSVLARVTNFDLAQKLDQITVYYNLRGRISARNLFSS